MRRQRFAMEPEHAAWGETLTRAMVDLFMLSLLVLIVRQPSFGVRDVTLPNVVIDESSAESTGASNVGTEFEVRLKADGVWWKGQRVELAGLAQRIAADTPATEAIIVVLELDKDGLGPLESFVDLQLQSSKIGLWNRMQISTRSNATGPEVQP